MGDVLLVYLIVQLVSTAYGLSVIETVKPLVKQRLYDRGYVLKNKNSMYKFNEHLINFFKGLIPFYYATKAVNLIKSSDAIDKAMTYEIKKGNYITKEEAYNEILVINENKSLIEVNSDPVISFEKPEKYTARKNNFILTETNEEEVKYDVIEENRSENLEITPFSNNYIKERKITNSEIVNGIMNLPVSDLKILNTEIDELIEIKKGNKILKLKDVA